MIKRKWKLLLVTSIVCLLPIIVGAVLWDMLPEQIPIHWNVSGEVDGWTNKLFAVFGMPAVMLAIHWLCVFMRGLDPKKQNHSDKMISLTFWMIPAISILISSFMYVSAIGRELSVKMISIVFLGILFMIIGNYMPKCKQNYTIGIKIAWTLSSEENWNKTHRLAGKLWVACGLIITVLGVLELALAVFAVALIMAVVPIIYSGIIYFKKK